MKHFLFILAFIVPMLAFTGCGGDDEPEMKIERWTVSELESVPSFVCKERRLIDGTVTLKFQGGKIYIKEDGESILPGSISYTVSDNIIEVNYRDILAIEFGQEGYSRKGFIYKYIQPNGDVELYLDISSWQAADIGWWLSDTYLETSKSF